MTGCRYSRNNPFIWLLLFSSVLHLHGFSLFNLGQHCEGRQSIDFCLRRLMGTRISLSSWGFTAGCDNTQNMPLNLGANLLPNQAKLKITWCCRPPTLRWAVTHTQFSSDKRWEIQHLTFKEKDDTQVWPRTEVVGGSCRVMLRCSIPDTHRSARWQAEVVCCFKSGDNCSPPHISTVASAVNLALHFLTQKYIFTLRREAG